MATSATRKIIQLLVEVCTTELEPYSRYLGRNPDAASTLEGLLQLPVTLWPQSARTELDDLEVRIGDDLIIMSFGELAGRFKSAGTLSRDKVLALARALESRQIGMEPDVLAGSRTPKAEDRIALFVTQPEDGAPVSRPLTKDQRIIFGGRRWQVREVYLQAKVIMVSAARAGAPPSVDGLGAMVHDTVREEIRAVLAESTPCPFLDSGGQQLLNEARTLFGGLGLADRYLVEVGASVT